MTRLRSYVLACVALLAALAPAFAQDPIGLTALRNRLGPAAPTGAGVPVMQAEALEVEPPPFLYLANNGNPEIAGRVTDRSGGGGISAHANSVAVAGFGIFTGVAPGVPSIDGFK